MVPSARNTAACNGRPGCSPEALHAKAFCLVPIPDGHKAAREVHACSA